MVKINISMPKSCYKCGRYELIEDDNVFICLLDNHGMHDIWESSIDSSCPLIDESNQICCNCNHSEKDYDYDGSFYCYYWDYEQGMSPNRVSGDDFCSNWEKIGK